MASFCYRIRSTQKNKLVKIQILFTVGRGNQFYADCQYMVLTDAWDNKRQTVKSRFTFTDDFTEQQGRELTKNLAELRSHILGEITKDPEHAMTKTRLEKIIYSFHHPRSLTTGRHVRSRESLGDYIARFTHEMEDGTRLNIHKLRYAVNITFDEVIRRSRKKLMLDNNDKPAPCISVNTLDGYIVVATNFLEYCKRLYAINPVALDGFNVKTKARPGVKKRAFNQGELGMSTIAQVGQDIGALLSRGGSLQAVESTGNVVLVETVGVGQSETAVAGMTDMFVLMQLPNAGDDLQAIKKGVMEIADLVVINKADIDKNAATRAEAQITSSLRLLGQHGNPENAHHNETQWHPKVVQISALLGQGVDGFWAAVSEYQRLQTANGRLAQRREKQALAWMWERIEAGLKLAFRQHPQVRALLPQLQQDVVAGRIAASTAARNLLLAQSGQAPAAIE